MKQLFLICILSLTSNLLFSQIANGLDTIKENKSIIIKDSRVDKLNTTYRSSYKLMGYRVQIYSGNKRQPANQARSIVTRLYKNKKAHLDYEQPSYKVRVGDFRTKIEALKFKNELIKHFPNCFIIKDEIDINELNLLK